MKTNEYRAAICAVVLLSGCGSGAPGGDAAVPARQAEVSCSQSSDPRIRAMSDAGIFPASARGLPAGRYALPATDAPTQMVVMFHGHLNDSCSWRNHLRQVAAAGAVAVAMDYTGQARAPVENYGWFVREGAADSIRAAQYFLKQYPSIKTVIAFGISMGGNASAIAVASPDAVRADGSPLWDWWLSIEGVNNLIEEYLIIRAVAPVNAGAALAQQEIEEEAGGTLEEVPQEYLALTGVARAGDMTELKGAVMVHALDDGLVPATQSREMAAALNAVGVPAHLYTVIGRGDGETGTTFTATVGDPLFGAAGQEYESPFAGHGWEGSDTQLVIRTGFEQLFAIMAGGTVEAGETPVPGV